MPHYSMQLEETLDVLVNRHFPEKKLKKNFLNLMQKTDILPYKKISWIL